MFRESVMRKCFFLLLFIINFTEGCDVRDQFKVVTGYSGGSVLLPCACEEPQSKPESFTWKYQNLLQKKWIKVFKDEKYKNKLKLFNQNSPANLSLLISDLRKKDEGIYRCQTSSDLYREIRVMIKGCDLDQNKQSLQVTGHSGESVVLPCYCSELQDKPRQLKWTFTPLNNRTNPVEIHPKEKIEQHRGRVKLLNEISPGNLSLLISNLTKKDQGEYHCSVHQQRVNITLRIQEKPEDYLGKWILILLSVFPILLLLAILGLIYKKCRGRRNDQQMSTHGLVDVNPASVTQRQNVKQKEDEVIYSSVVHVRNKHQ